MHATLTSRQERFVVEYLKDQNASAAAARAGYTARNMAAQGNELMSNPAVRERVRQEMQAVLAQTRRAALALMQQRMRAAHFRADRMFAEDWELLPLEDLDEETRQVLEVSTVQRKCGPVTRVRQPDRHKALRALEKAHEKLEQLNEQYYARLAKEAAIPSLEEIDAVEDAAVAAVTKCADADISEKDQVLSGWPPVAPMDGEEADSIFAKNISSLLSSASAAMSVESDIAEKCQVLSGSAASTAEAGRALFAEKPQAISGSKICAGKAMPARFAEKPQGLSGSVGAKVRWLTPLARAMMEGRVRTREAMAPP